jgi:uncharacterized membrane protein YdjX (TVP38/TMEM64 family)
MQVDAPRPDPTPLRERLRRCSSAFGGALPWVLAATGGPLLGVVVLAATAGRWLPIFGADIASAALFVALGSFAAAACLLPTHATSLVAGFVFGPLYGPLLAWLVILLAATAGYLGLRTLVGERAVAALARAPRAAAVHAALFGAGARRSFALVALLRLSPLLPFGVTNVLLAAVRLPLRVFVPATLAGITPRAAGVALLGAELQALDLSAGPGAWWTVLAIVATVVVLWQIGRLARTALRARLPGV